MDFFFSEVLNGFLNSNFLKEYKQDMWYNRICGIFCICFFDIVEFLEYGLWDIGRVFGSQNNFSFIIKLKVINLGYLKVKNENFGSI